MLSSSLETQAVPATAVAPPIAEQPAILDHDPAETTVHDGVIYNADGEMIGLDDSAPALDSGDDADEREANRIVRSMTRTFHRQRAAYERRDAIAREMTAIMIAVEEKVKATPEYRALLAELDQADAIAAKAGSRLDWLRSTYLDFLRMFALPRLTGKSRTLETLVGSISLRKVAARVDVTDELAAVESLAALGEDAAIKRTVLKSGISAELAIQILNGEANLSGFVVVPEAQKVGLTVGGVKIV